MAYLSVYNIYRYYKGMENMKEQDINIQAGIYSQTGKSMIYDKNLHRNFMKIS